MKYLHGKWGCEVEGAALGGCMVSYMDCESWGLPQLGEEPQQDGVLGIWGEHNHHVAVRGGNALQPEAFGGEEVAGTGYFLLEKFGSCNYAIMGPVYNKGVVSPCSIFSWAHSTNFRRRKFEGSLSVSWVAISPSFDIRN